MQEDLLTIIYCDVDEFCKDFEDYYKTHLLSETGDERSRIFSKSQLSIDGILSYCITPGNVDDRDLKTIDFLTKELYGKLFTDRGYLSSRLSEFLQERNIMLFTKLKKNMKNKLIHMTDKLLLRRRVVIESVNDFLKNICNIDHFRHRSCINFLVNLFLSIVAYSFLPKKPSFIKT